MAFWTKKSPELEALQEIASQLKLHNHLYRLALEQTGINVYTGNEVGEVLSTDLDAIQKKEFDDEVRRAYGLRADQQLEPLAPDGRSWRAYLLAQAEEGEAKKEPAGAGEQLFESSGAWGLGVGPEGAESTEPGAAEAWIDQFNPPSAFERQRSGKEPEGESRPDSSAEPERGSEEHSLTVSTTTGT